MKPASILKILSLRLSASAPGGVATILILYRDNSLRRCAAPPGHNHQKVLYKKI
jgi:hypothetical protein